VARRYRHEYLGVEHVLLALLEAAPQPAVAVLQRWGTTPQQVRAAVEAVIQAGPGPVPRGRLPRTPSLERALQIAGAAAARAGGTENAAALLLGLASEEGGLVNEILSRLGVPRSVVCRGLVEQGPRAGGAVE
jgi:ATP-dependent Clp protease ATP-binding subunit ClpA